MTALAQSAQRKLSLLQLPEKLGNNHVAPEVEERILELSLAPPPMVPSRWSSRKR